MGFQTWVGFVILDMKDFDIRLGLTLLSPYYIVLNFKTEVVTLDNTGRERIEREGMYKPKPTKITSSIGASKLVHQGCLAYLANARVKSETPSIGSIPVVSEFSEVPHHTYQEDHIQIGHTFLSIK